MWDLMVLGYNSINVCVCLCVSVCVCVYVCGMCVHWMWTIKALIIP